METSKAFGLIFWYCTQMAQIALVSNQHNDDVAVRMIAKFLLKRIKKKKHFTNFKRVLNFTP